MSLLSPPRRPLLMPAWSRNDLWRRAAAVPSLDLNFAAAKALGPLVTFTRASTATFIDSSGVLQTAATDVPRFDHNPTTGESLGLLVEEQRTNLLLNSATLSTQSVTVTAVAHTLSFYGTGTVTLTGASIAGPTTGTGAFPTRTTLTFTPSAGTLTLTVTGSVTFAQLEAGALATSYIPTTAAATRSADVASITGANFSSWYRQDEGTFYFSAKTNFAVPAGAFPRVFQVQAASSSDKIEQSFYNAGQVCFVRTTAAIQAEWYPNYFIQNGVTSSLAVAANNIAGSSNGVITGTDSVAVLPTVDRMQIGAEAAAGNHLNGTIRRLTYWPQRLANTTLQQITQ